MYPLVVFNYKRRPVTEINRCANMRRDSYHT